MPTLRLILFTTFFRVAIHVLNKIHLKNVKKLLECLGVIVISSEMPIFRRFVYLRQDKLIGKAGIFDLSKTDC